MCSIFGYWPYPGRLLGQKPLFAQTKYVLDLMDWESRVLRPYTSLFFFSWALSIKNTIWEGLYWKYWAFTWFCWGFKSLFYILERLLFKGNWSMSTLQMFMQFDFCGENLQMSLGKTWSLKAKVISVVITWFLYIYRFLPYQLKSFITYHILACKHFLWDHTANIYDQITMEL